MAFFSITGTVPESILAPVSKKILLYALRRIEILDKDPGEHLKVQLGKSSTVELHNVGLSIKVRKSNCT